jgi:tetratricopeptide (TPR) repeat protein
MHRVTHAGCVLGACLMGCLWVAIAAAGPPQGRGQGAATIIGPHPLLTEGADALSRGDFQRGVDLTEQGLKLTTDPQNRAAAMANICAGYAGLHNFASALSFCNQSVEVYQGNWRAWQNRAAAHLGLGRLQESLEDIRHGLELNPRSQALQKTLGMVKEYERTRPVGVRVLIES